MKFSSQELQRIHSLIEKIPEGGMYEPNLFRSTEEYETALMLAHKTWDQKRYPGVFTRLSMTRDAHRKILSDVILKTPPRDKPETKFGFFESGVTKLNKDDFSTTAFGAVVGGFQAMDITVFIFDSKSKEFLGSANDIAVNDIYKSVSLKTSITGNSGKYTVLLRASWDPRGGGAALNRYSKLETGTYFLAASDPILSDPVRRSNNPAKPGEITIGLGRPYNDQGPGSAMDYAWNQASQDKPKGMIPFVGYATFSRPIRALQPDHNFIVQIGVVNTLGGGGYFPIHPENLAAVYARFSIDPANKRILRWNFAPGQTTTDPGSPIVFDRINWPSDMQATFFFRAIVILDNGEFSEITVRSHAQAPDNPPDGHLPILPITFIWHCIEEGAAVLMENGTEKKIEDIIAGDIVTMEADGETARVAWTTRGAHDGIVYEIETEDGGTVVASDSHVFITETGSCLASELRVADGLFKLSRTHPGNLELSLVKTIKLIQGYKNTMCNLALDFGANEKRRLGTYFANSFLVGDSNSFAMLQKVRASDIDYLKSVVSPLYHQDIDSLFEDQNF